MQLSEQRQIQASPAKVWTAILDPEVLKACIPGCESMKGSLADGYEATVVQKIGPVKATFTGVVTLSDIVEGQTVTISGEGKGGAAGYAKGGARVTLEPKDGGTLLSYEVNASVGGKIAQLGSRLIDGVAAKMAAEFFERFSAAVGEPALQAAPAEGQAEGTGSAGDAPAEEKKGWFKKIFG